MNNVFAGLARPIADRPGSARRAFRPAVKRPTVELQERPNPWNLAPVQCVIACLLSEGMADDEIGGAMGLPARTVEGHVSRIRRRMGDASRLRAAVLWDRFERGE